MSDEAKKRAEASDRAAECRERAAQYEDLADEPKRRGDIEMSTNAARRAAEERLEAQRIDQGIGQLGD